MFDSPGFSPILISYLVGLKPIVSIITLSIPPAKAGGNSSTSIKISSTKY